MKLEIGKHIDGWCTRKTASRAYTMSARFEVGEIIAHSTFALGVVTAEREGTEIDILFPHGPKILLRGNHQSVPAPRTLFVRARAA